MIYRVLEVEEWNLVGHEFDKREIPMPDPRFAMIVAAFEDEESVTVQGFVVLQLQFHMEPLVVYNPVVVRGLISTAEQELVKRVGPTHYYCFAKGRTAELAEALGIQRVNMDIFHKAVE